MAKKKHKPEYWLCIIGPVTGDKLRNGADLPMRMTVQKAFYDLTGEGAAMCSSGWGVPQEEVDALSKLSLEMYKERTKNEK